MYESGVKLQKRAHATSESLARFDDDIDLCHSTTKAVVELVDSIQSVVDSEDACEGKRGSNAVDVATFVVRLHAVVESSAPIVGKVAASELLGRMALNKLDFTGKALCEGLMRAAGNIVFICNQRYAIQVLKFSGQCRGDDLEMQTSFDDTKRATWNGELVEAVKDCTDIIDSVIDVCKAVGAWGQVEEEVSKVHIEVWFALKAEYVELFANTMRQYVALRTAARAKLASSPSFAPLAASLGAWDRFETCFGENEILEAVRVARSTVSRRPLAPKLLGFFKQVKAVLV